MPTIEYCDMCGRETSDGVCAECREERDNPVIDLSRKKPVRAIFFSRLDDKAAVFARVAKVLELRSITFTQRTPCGHSWVIYPHTPIPLVEAVRLCHRANVTPSRNYDGVQLAHSTTGGLYAVLTLNEAERQSRLFYGDKE